MLLTPSFHTHKIVTSAPPAGSLPTAAANQHARSNPRARRRLTRPARRPIGPGEPPTRSRPRPPSQLTREPSRPRLPSRRWPGQPGGRALQWRRQRWLIACRWPSRSHKIVTRSWDRPDEFMSPYTEGVIARRQGYVRARSRAASGPAGHPRGVLCPSGVRPGLLRAVVKTPIRSDDGLSDPSEQAPVDRPVTSERLSEAERRCQSSSGRSARERDGLRRARQRGPCPFLMAAIAPGPG